MSFFYFYLFIYFIIEVYNTLYTDESIVKYPYTIKTVIVKTNLYRYFFL